MSSDDERIASRDWCLGTDLDLFSFCCLPLLAYFLDRLSDVLLGLPLFSVLMISV